MQSKEKESCRLLFKSFTILCLGPLMRVQYPKFAYGPLEVSFYVFQLTVTRGGDSGTMEQWTRHGQAYRARRGTRRPLTCTGGPLASSPVYKGQRTTAGIRGQRNRDPGVIPRINWPDGSSVTSDNAVSAGYVWTREWNKRPKWA